MAVYGYVGLCMAMYGCVGLCVARYAYVWLCRAVYVYVWLCMAVYGYVELCMAMDVGVCLCSRMYACIDLFVQITRDVSWGIHGLLTLVSASAILSCRASVRTCRVSQLHYGQ